MANKILLLGLAVGALALLSRRTDATSPAASSQSGFVQPTFSSAATTEGWVSAPEMIGGIMPAVQQATAELTTEAANWERHLYIGYLNWLQTPNYSLVASPTYHYTYEQWLSWRESQGI